MKERDTPIFRVTSDAVYLSDGDFSKLKSKKIYEDYGLDSGSKVLYFLEKMAA